MSALTQTYGALGDAPFLVNLIVLALTFGLLAFQGARLWVWTLVGVVVLWLLGASTFWWILFVPAAVVLNIPPLRAGLVSKPILAFLQQKKLLPEISDTERAAIEAGTVWVDRELFSGRPNTARLNSEPYPSLSAAERAFIDGPVEEVCRMVNDWNVDQERDLPPAVWEFLKRERFFGMIVPQEYGGLGFSATAHSAVIQKLASRSLSLAITVMVPNSLGPAELLLHFGTWDQRKHYLPRLARGEEIPCFALTEPGAGSDAGAITSSGKVFRGDDGELYLRLNWDKRYITLAAVSTLLGLAFQLEDPDNLLGKGKRPGITCALVPSTSEGVVLTRRHDPLGVPFYNCPTSGKDVIVPIDAVIGGQDGIGKGWSMLMECLAAGRGISLPATSTGGAKLVARVAGAYAAVRQQFGLPIGRFEGVQEPLARIGGLTYMLDAARLYTVGGLDAGAKPPVVTAMAKLNFTELYRTIINDGMDILGGAGISRGPNNLLAQGYIGCPISITVEGANILTRTMIIFGQGAIRCHPYAYSEIDAMSRNDVRAFDDAFFRHVGHVVRNGVRSLGLSLSRGYLSVPPVQGAAAPYWRKLSWASASFAFWSDIAMAALGGNLKRKEALTGRFADVLSWMYLATCTLRRFDVEGRRREDEPYLHWSMQHAFAQIHAAFQGLFHNLNIPVVGWFLRGPIAAWARLNPIGKPPADRFTRKVATAMQTPGEDRDRMTADIFMPPANSKDEPLRRLEKAFELAVKADAIVAKLKAAMRAGRLTKGRPAQVVTEALEKDLLIPEEAELLKKADAARAEAMAVDSFTLDDYLRTARKPDGTKDSTAFSEV